MVAIDQPRRRREASSAENTARIRIAIRGRIGRPDPVPGVKFSVVVKLFE